MNLWFIPTRIRSNESHGLIKAETLDEAINQVKNSKLYYKKFYALSKKEQEEIRSNHPPSIHGLDLFELEDDFFKKISMKNQGLKRVPQKIPECEYKYYNKKQREYYCKGLDKREHSYYNLYCIIHSPHFKSDLPENCPFLKIESDYIGFTE